MTGENEVLRQNLAPLPSVHNKPSMGCLGLNQDLYDDREVTICYSQQPVNLLMGDGKKNSELKEFEHFLNIIYF